MYLVDHIALLFNTKKKTKTKTKKKHGGRDRVTKYNGVIISETITEEKNTQFVKPIKIKKCKNCRFLIKLNSPMWIGKRAIYGFMYFIIC